MDTIERQSAFKVIHDLGERIGALKEALTDYVDGDGCECYADSADDDELTVCRWCRGNAALGNEILPQQRNEMARAWLAAHPGT